MKKLALLLFLFPTFSHAEKPKDNSDLIALVETDQADRTGDTAKMIPGQVVQHDIERRNRTLKMLENGEIRTARDYFNAALIFQHSQGKEDIRIALAFATLSRALAPENPAPTSLQAAAWDRYLVRMGQLQWYGTQYAVDPKTGKATLAPIAASVISEKERKELGLPTLEEANHQKNH